METYTELNKKCEELQMYTKRVMDLYCDAKKWHWMAETVHDVNEKQKYMEISDTLMSLFNKEVENMRV